MVTQRTFFSVCALLTSSLILTACQSPAPVANQGKPATPHSIPPANPSSIPDAVPQTEALSTRGNPAFYDVLGQRYFVKTSAAGYVERGIASWYGPGFHKEFTSNGEPYDMYGMTAAHKTLPLPSYVQVTNLNNGKQVILRVNDRGPFKDGRIIDLSYTAAAKLDILKAGTAMVEVRAITPGESAATATDKIKAMYVQVGTFSNASNADKLAEQLRNQGYVQTTVRNDLSNGRSLYRVRIGPLADANNFDQVVAQLKTLGYADARLADN
ncbi:MAG: septal ring lytic transglycosylase RlpA family protein [Steroidobacteraceae bacterium]